MIGGDPAIDRRRDWLWQTVGVAVGVIPAFLAVWALIVGLLFYGILGATLLLFPRLRSFGYGFLCAMLVAPGLYLGIWWSQ